MTYLEAARKVLESAGRPLHSSEITRLALDAGYIVPVGKTPEATMAAQLYSAIKRAGDAGEPSEFRRTAGSTFELALASHTGALDAEIKAKNEAVMKELHAFLGDMHPRQVELLIGKLLGSLGFEEVEVTKYVGDSGVDIEATLTLGGVTSVRTAVQVKRYKHKIAGDLVRQIRGSLQADQRGMIITTGKFTPDAVGEASATGKTPISLIDGPRLVELLVQEQIGVKKQELTVLSLDLDDLLTVEDQSHGKAASLWPLPGGATQYVASLFRMLDFVAKERPEIEGFVGWVLVEYPSVKSRGVALSALRSVLYALRLVSFADDHVVLTDQGEALRQSRSVAELLATLTTRVVGIAEILTWLAVEPMSTAQIHKRLNAELALEWETETQPRIRLDWLSATGAVTREGDKWAAARPSTSVG